MLPRPLPPTLLGVVAFNMSRTVIRNTLSEANCDYRYYRDRGWFESEYYYPTRLGPGLKAVDLVTRGAANLIWPARAKVPAGG